MFAPPASIPYCNNNKLQHLSSPFFCSSVNLKSLNLSGPGCLFIGMCSVPNTTNVVPWRLPKKQITHYLAIYNQAGQPKNIH